MGTVDQMHAILSSTIARTTGAAVKKLPLGDGRGDPAWLDALTQQHASECRALGIAGPPSFSEFSLGDPGEFASFTFQLANDLERIRSAAGVI